MIRCRVNELDSVTERTSPPGSDRLVEYSGLYYDCVNEETGEAGHVRAKVRVEDLRGLPGRDAVYCSIDWLEAYPQRSGFGTAALFEVLRHFVGRGCEVLAGVSDETATGYWEKLGFDPYKQPSHSMKVRLGGGGAR